MNQTQEDSPQKNTEKKYRVLTEREVGAVTDGAEEFACDVLMGLSGQSKSLPSKYFYDDAGSEYFQQIMNLEEYYPTRCEYEIFERHADQIAEVLAGRPVDIIDLGAGDGAKTLVLLEAFTRAGHDCRYIPIDISEGAMRSVVASLEQKLPQLPIAGLVSEYTNGLRWIRQHDPGRTKLVLFLGSNIGNFSRASARAFLRRLWSVLEIGDYVCMGFDLKKDIEVLLRAYADPHGITAAFNLNLLKRINRELEGEFDLRKFRHFGTYNVFSGAMESYLISLETQSVYVGALEHEFSFDAWEPIHTEYSYKYLPSDIRSLAADTGFHIASEYTDAREWFCESLWRVEKHTREQNES